MSSGSKAPAAPDMSTDIGNAGSIFNTATSNAGQTFNTAQNYNQNAQNTLSQVNGANTPMMNQVNGTAQANLNSYQQNFMPLQQQQIQQAKDYTSDQNTSQLQGMAVADQNASLQSSLANQRAALASEGVDPASVHGSALTTQAQIQGAASNANAANQSYLSTQATGRQLVQGANQLGLQVGQAGTTGAQAGSGIGSQMVGNENQTNAAGINNLTAANTYLNTGVNANQSGANIANQQFQDQLISQQANQASKNSTYAGYGSMLGMGLGMGMSGASSGASMFQHGGVVPGPHGYAAGGPVGHPSHNLGMARTPAVAPFSGGGVLPRQLPNNYDEGGSVGMVDNSSLTPYDPNTGGSGRYTIDTPGSPGQQMYAPMTANGNWDSVGNAPNQVPGAAPGSSAPGGGVPGAAMAQTPQNYVGSAMGAFGGAMASAEAASYKPSSGGGGGGAMMGAMGMDRGGMVSSQGALPNSPIPGSTDTKPAWLTPGEFVIPHDVASWKGHEYWYKQMDKARADMHAQHGRAPPPPMAMTSRGH